MFTNKYFVILTVLTTVGGIVDNFKGGNVQYFYIKFLLGGAENPLMYTVYQVATGVPLGLGAIIAYPLAKKFGIRNIAIVGYSLVLAGSVMGWFFPSNLPVAIAAGFLRQTGMIPNAYIVATLMCFAFDSVEFKSHLRLEGLLGVAVITAIQSAIYAPFAGGFESSILRLGFVDVEKKLPEINGELLRRKKQAVLARGEEWIEPEELERREREQAEIEREENRIHDLKEYCARKGLDFDTENRKYLEKQAQKKNRRGDRQ